MLAEFGDTERRATRSTADPVGLLHYRSRPLHPLGLGVPVFFVAPCPPSPPPSNATASPCALPSVTMVTLVAIGTLLIAAGPSIALWLGMLQRRAHLLVIAIISAFTWCLSIMLASIIWFAIPPLKGVYPWVLFVAVTTQELSRLMLFLIFRQVGKVSLGVQVFLRPSPKDTLLTSVSVGVGFALMFPLIHFFSVLADSFADDTAIYVEGCPINFFVAASSFAMAFSLLHILLAVLAWPSYADPDGRFFVILTYLIHLGVSEASLSNRRENGCVIGMGLIWAFVVLLAVFTFFVSKRRVFGNPQ